MHTDLSHTSRGAQRVMLGVAAILSWLLSMTFSLVVSPHYTVPVLLALEFAVVHFAVVAVLIRDGSSALRFCWLLLSLPLVIYTIDNLGRLSYTLGGPLFRLLI